MSVVRPESKRENQELTDKEKMFIERYMTHFNGARAAREAGYAIDGSRNDFNAAHEILRKPYIKKAIAERFYAVCMETNEVLARLATIARADIIAFMSQDEDGNWFVDIEKIRESGQSFVVKSYIPSRLGPPTIELYSALDALDKIAKHLGVYKPDETNVNLSLSAWSQFVQAAKRPELQPADAAGVPDELLERYSPSAAPIGSADDADDDDNDNDNAE